ncbi:4-diphosphocytidyl-2-C-methyl-D-erythritol kinase [Artomyces pyxidatus]|uniref:4-diphosphocytidyl-2-C-methyl-D-erythritol kinase n=1 Tax=Artomyces pyxidatus TaxID=48021 RepID=A0ACB8SSP7_9AGAM|nr:4-diphosphocytidyl-2-C-methyl-D-erythritol kinase [Artomyces pyxidatus]
MAHAAVNLPQAAEDKENALAPSATSENELVAFAPAKLNLFLHVTGRRPDRYHIIQTAFQPLDYHDELRFTPRADPSITLQCVRDCSLNLIDEETFAALDSPENLVLRAAHALQARSPVPRGASIVLRKRIPVGSGLGGGSADAAATLLALNRLWGMGLPVEELAEIGLRLGVDVPVLVHGRAAWGENIGDKLVFMEPAERWYVVLFPAVAVLTKTIFVSPSLKRDTVPITLEDFLHGGVDTHNDLEPVAAALHPPVAEAIKWLSQLSPTRMSGSGSSVFAAFDREEEAKSVLAQVPDQWGAFVTRGVNKWDHFSGTGCSA